MPSAANNVKIDRHIAAAENATVESSSSSSSSANAASSSTPLRQAITVIEHKIRNLEKRKVSAVELGGVFDLVWWFFGDRHLFYGGYTKWSGSWVVFEVNV